MPAFCPVCAYEDYTTEGVTEDGRRFVVCNNTREHGPDGHVWEPIPENRTRTRGDGLGAELDIWNKLLECVPADGRTHPYGEVEDLFVERYPEDRTLLQAEYGHKFRDGKRNTTPFSMSAYLSQRLSELADEGALVKTWGRAEPPWAHNGTISHWTRG